MWHSKTKEYKDFYFTVYSTGYDKITLLLLKYRSCLSTTHDYNFVFKAFVASFC